MKILISLIIGIIVGGGIVWWYFPQIHLIPPAAPNCSLALMEDSMHQGLYMQCTNGQQSGEMAMDMEGSGGGETLGNLTFYHDIGNENYDTQLIQYIPMTCNLN